METVFGSEQVNNVVTTSSETTHVDVSTLFDGPSHVLPPLSTLYKSFMDMLLITDKNSTETEPNGRGPESVESTEDDQMVTLSCNIVH
jgi:hypothetical protein